MNPNDSTSKYYDIVYSHVKGQDVIDAEIDLIQSITKPFVSVLDLACGTGRHAIPLTELGYRVTAIDSSRGMLQELDSKLKVRGSEQKPSVSNSRTQNLKLIHDDFFTHNFGNQQFELILMMWNAFNEMCLTEDDVERLFRKFRRVGPDHDQGLLTENGTILINLDDSEFIDPESLTHDLFVHEGGRIYESILNVESFDVPTNTTVCKETIRVFDLQRNLLESASTLIKQRWWRLDEIEKLCNGQIDTKKLNVNEELYLVISY